MSSLYDNIDSNNLDSNKEYARLYAPQLTRTRQIYKGPRNSEKVNLEIGQILYDLNKISEKIRDIKTAQEQVILAFSDGYNGQPRYPNLASADTFLYTLIEAYDDYTLSSLQDVQTKVSILAEEIKHLMNGIYHNG